MLRPKLEVKLAQRLILTPSLQQAIRLLQLTRVELVDLIRTEIQENPVLEEIQLEGQPESAPAAKEESPIDRVDMESYFQEYYESAYIPSTLPREAREDVPLESLPAGGMDLPDHLLWQLDLVSVPLRLREPVEYLIGNLNNDGYLADSLEELSAHSDYPAPLLQEALALLQTLDPKGVGARSAQECLLLQTEDPLLGRALREQWDLLLERNEEGLQQALNVTREEVLGLLVSLKQLDPYPGKKYSRDTTIYVEPDVVVIREGEGYLALVNDEGLPKLRISRTYLHMFRDPDLKKDKETSSYVEKKLHSAFWLLRSVEQRRRTLQRVAQAIIDSQKEFLDTGPERLKPLMLKDIAQRVSVHESTVSRVVANKYMQTPRGLYPMRYFFLSGFKSPSGEGYTLDNVKGLIGEIIRGETAGRPLSDAKIARLLVQQHRLPIARRTVAKYREELGIPTSQERKEKR